MNSLFISIGAFVGGLALAGATAFGVVQSQQSAGTKPLTTSQVDYGSNN